MLDVNTTSRNPTHFLRAVELIEKARGDFKVPSENWPHPSTSRFGIPNDRYYAEIWIDGMDWQPSYWIIEEKNLEKPQIQPLIVFNHHEERNTFNSWDFEDLLRAIMYYRREYIWLRKNDLGLYTESVWPFLTLFKDEVRHEKMKAYAFEHASQPKVVFWLNEAFIPEVYRGRNSNSRKQISDCSQLNSDGIEANF